MKLGLIQSKQNELYDFDNPKLYLSRERVLRLQEEMETQVISLIKEACSKGCDFIVTSEAINFCGVPKSIDCDYREVIPELGAPLFKVISDIAKEEKKYIALGAYHQRNGRMYNSLLVYDPEGQQKFLYDKIHLAGSEQDRLTPGMEYLVMDTEYGKIGAAICWDMQFPEVCRELVLRGAELIICPTWGWEQIYGHARAYENGVYVASAMSVPYQNNITGIRNPSEVISPEGKLLASGSRHMAEVITCELDIHNCKAARKMRMSNRHPETYRYVGKA